MGKIEKISAGMSAFAQSLASLAKVALLSRRPSVAVTADAAIKIASVRDAFADTDTFLEMTGFTQADIRRIKAQETRVRGSQILTQEFAENEN